MSNDATAEAKEYKVATILDIARIPEEALPRFIEELPSIVEYLRPYAAIEHTLDPEKAQLLTEAALWVDDGKNEHSASIRVTHKE